MSTWIWGMFGDLPMNIHDLAPRPKFWHLSCCLISMKCGDWRFCSIDEFPWSLPDPPTRWHKNDPEAKLLRGFPRTFSHTWQPNHYPNSLLFLHLLVVTFSFNQFKQQTASLLCHPIWYLKNFMLEWSHLDSFPKPHSAEQTLVSVLNKLLLDLTVLIISN